MNPAARTRRLRLLSAQERMLQAELTKVRSEQRQLENDASHALGFAVPLRGRQLLNEICRAEAKAVANG